MVLWAYNTYHLVLVYHYYYYYYEAGGTREQQLTVFLAEIRVLLTNQKDWTADVLHVAVQTKGRMGCYYRNHDFNVYFTSISCVSCIGGGLGRDRQGDREEEEEEEGGSRDVVGRRDDDNRW